MQLRQTRRLFAVGLALALTALLGVFAYRSSAAYNRGAELYALSTEGERTCDKTGQRVPLVYQTKEFGVALRQFWDNESVYISIVFPDGRVFSPNAAGQLDGLVDMPPNFPWVAVTSNGGDYYAPFKASASWPRGCYQLTGWGFSSNRLASGYFYLDSLPLGPINSGRATMVVEDNTTGDPSGMHGATVNIFGRAFRAQETVDVWITAPDGTVISYPSQFTSDAGSFASTFTFDSRFPAGRYHFTAKGHLSGFQVISTFDLAAHNTTSNSYARLYVLWRYPAETAQNEAFEISGQYFDIFEPVVVWMTLPDNSVRTLPTQYANEYGEFFADVFVDERLPTGTYKFTAKGLNSNRVVISNDVMIVKPGDPVVNQVPLVEPAPIVYDNNSGAVNSYGGPDAQTGVPPADPPSQEYRPDAQIPGPARGPQGP